MSGFVLEHMKSGQVRGLAVSTSVRSPAAPELPTVAEAGIAGFDVAGFYALLAPARTPAAIVQKINADTNTTLAEAAVKGKLEPIGYLVRSSTPQELGSLLEAEIAKWGQLIQDLGISVSD